MSRAPSSLTGGIIWKNIAVHQRIAILSKKMEKMAGTFRLLNRIHTV